MNESRANSYTADDLRLAIEAALPREAPYDAIKALAGDPVLLAGSDEIELRRRYEVMRNRLLEAAMGRDATSRGE